MKKNIITITLLALLTGFGFTSCEDMLTPDMDRHNEIDAVAKDTLYSYWGILKDLQGIAERYVVLGECRGDLVGSTEFISDSINALLEFREGEETADGANRFLKMADYYQVINACNAYIAQCDTLVRTGTNRSYMGEEFAQVVSIRAWVYMQLLLAYREVPYFDKPLLSTEEIDRFLSNPVTITLDNFAETQTVALLEQVRKVDTPNYGTYKSMCHSTQCLFPQNLVLGDIYLLRGEYVKAAERYYDYLNSEKGGPIQANSYFLYFERKNDGNVQLGYNSSDYLSAYRWGSMFSSTLEVGPSNEVITVIPSSTNKLWGNVQRGVPELFGFTSDIVVASTTEDSLSSASVVLSPQFKSRQLTRSQAYVELARSQDYEAYIGTTDAWKCTVIKNAGDARSRFAVTNLADTEADNEDEQEPFVMKQNMGSGYIYTTLSGLRPYENFSTTYPIIYRKGSVWLRFAEALNGAGYPGYAFAILKSGLCNNELWLPKKESDYAVKDYQYYLEDEGDLANKDTIIYNSTKDLLSHLVARAKDEGITLDTDSALAAYRDSLDLLNIIWRRANAWQDTLPAQTTYTCYHIAKWETMDAANQKYPFLDFTGKYMQGDSRNFIKNNDGQAIFITRGGQTQATIDMEISSTFNSTPITAGIHSRGCGRISPSNSETTYNYVNQINKMRDRYGDAANKAPLTKEEIYDKSNLRLVQLAIQDLILDELALETAFEGNRFFDLVCYKNFIGGQNGVNAVAKKIAKRDGTTNAALESKLQDERNWYFKMPERYYKK